MTTSRTRSAPAKPRIGGRRRRWPLAVGAVLALVAGGAVWRRRTHPLLLLRAEVEIDAGPDEVWQVLADLPAYAEWNPYVVRSTGDLRVGATLTNVHEFRSGQRTFTPTVLAVEPGRELRWMARLPVPGIFAGEHSFVITPIAPGRVRLVQEETFRGVAVPIMRGWLHSQALPAFEELNAALQERVETLYPRP
ncbi:SRPBCC domain-containing protein [Actinopolymorpha pittospori]|uniref:Polyketide cyclase / dehydrase and lipid transport n=1 Tax=Actinopolymorpha pittospori TaxID=648752 RepID=A0A927RIP5_9ACTN|nr:SRPBCC domain-containing protein [Actinopolymorpha pittospori]MBE1606406.1 hypothetical protein [Actinopolymorpha pittospori]